MQNLFSKNNHLKANLVYEVATFYFLIHKSTVDVLLLHQILKIIQTSFIYTINNLWYRKLAKQLVRFGQRSAKTVR